MLFYCNTHSRRSSLQCVHACSRLWPSFLSPPHPSPHIYPTFWQVIPAMLKRGGDGGCCVINSSAAGLFAFPTGIGSHYSSTKHASRSFAVRMCVTVCLCVCVCV
jgi:hypothetical protein